MLRQEATRARVAQVVPIEINLAKASLDRHEHPPSRASHQVVAQYRDARRPWQNGSHSRSTASSATSICRGSGFATAPAAKGSIEDWRRHYNEVRVAVARVTVARVPAPARVVDVLAVSVTGVPSHHENRIEHISSMSQRH